MDEASDAHSRSARNFARSLVGRGNTIKGAYPKVMKAWWLATLGIRGPSMEIHGKLVEELETPKYKEELF